MEKCEPKDPFVGLDRPCACKETVVDLCTGCDCVTTGSCTPFSIQKHETVCTDVEIEVGAEGETEFVGGVKGKLKVKQTCTEVLVGKKCLCSGEIEIECKDEPKPSGGPSTRIMDTSNRQEWNDDMVLKSRILVGYYQKRLRLRKTCTAHIYENGEVKNRTCIPGPSPMTDHFM